MTSNSVSEGDVNHAGAYGLLAATVLIWATGIVIARGVHNEIPLIGLSFWRWFCATLILFPFVRRDLLAQKDLVKAHLGVLAIQGFLIVGGGTMLFYAANYTGAINVALVNSTQPVVTVLMAWLLVRERLGSIQVIGVLAAVVGVLIMISKADWNTLRALEFNFGDLLAIIAVCGYAIYAINIRKMPKELGPFPALFVIMSFGTAFLFPVYLVEASITGPMPITMVSVSAVAFMSIMVSIVSIAWWNIANGIVGPSRAAIFLNLMPVYAAILAIAFLGEQLYLYHFGGAVLVCAGIFLVIRR